MKSRSLPNAFLLTLLISVAVPVCADAQTKEAGSPPAVPPQPADQIVDNAELFSQASRKSLGDFLTTTGATKGVYVFLVVDRFESRAQMTALNEQLVKTWLDGRFGAVILYDTRYARMMILPSKQAEKLAGKEASELAVIEATQMTQNIRKTQQLLQSSTESITNNLVKARANAERVASLKKLITIALLIVAVVGAIMIARSFRARDELPANREPPELQPDWDDFFDERAMRPPLPTVNVQPRPFDPPTRPSFRRYFPVPDQVPLRFGASLTGGHSALQSFRPTPSKAPEDEAQPVEEAGGPS